MHCGAALLFLQLNLCCQQLQQCRQRSKPDECCGHKHCDAPLQGWIGGWLLPQEASYFALALPHGWWLFGLDLALDHDIDMCQTRCVCVTSICTACSALCVAVTQVTYQSSPSGPSVLHIL